MTRSTQVFAILIWFNTTLPPATAEIVGQVQLQPDEVIHSPVVTDLPEAIRPVLNEARQALLNLDLDLAREKLVKLSATDLPHTEIVLAQLLIEKGALKNARHLLEEFSSKPGNEFESHLVFAQIAVSESRWYDALTHLNACQNHPEPERWSAVRIKAVDLARANIQGLALEGQRAWSAAHDVYLSAFRSHSKSQAMLAGLGRTSFHLRQFPEAAKYFQALRSENSDRELAEITLAKLAHANHDSAIAEKFFTAALKAADPVDRSNAKLVYANWLLYCNRASEARQVLIDDDAGESLGNEWSYALAMSDRMLQDYSGARARLTTLHHQDPTSFAISNQLALVLIENSDEGLRARAMQIAEANTRNHPRLAESWSTLGWVQFRLGDTASAERNLTSALAAGPVSRDTALYMSLVKERLGDAKSAAALLELSRQADGPAFAAGAKTRRE